MILAIDFDRTIHDTDHPVEGRRMGPPIQGSREALQSLYSRGDTIVVHTLRAVNPSNLKHVEEWLAYYDIPFSEVTAVKPNADYFIDDRGVHFSSWEQVLGIINGVYGRN